MLGCDLYPVILSSHPPHTSSSPYRRPHPTHHAIFMPWRGALPFPSLPPFKPLHTPSCMDKQTLKFGVERSLHSLLLQGNSENRDIKGNYKEKKLGAKHNLKKEEELKNQGNFKAVYRYPATWYRYPRRKPTPNHVQAWIRRDPRPNP
ncbi:hypothetical protein PIB30_101335, partial [Stylosanthes scabra]|nr:hypothetical protein [Stylosanthes scabra]